MKYNNKTLGKDFWSVSSFSIHKLDLRSWTIFFLPSNKRQTSPAPPVSDPLDEQIHGLVQIPSNAFNIRPMSSS